MEQLPANQNNERKPEERPTDEIANLLTHGLGFIISIPASIFLMNQITQNGNKKLVFACALYSFSLVILYAASTLSHLFYDLRWRKFFRAVDQTCIFLLIAGSFTPFCVIYLNHDWWWLIGVVMWGIAIMGILQIIITRHAGPMTNKIYLLLGWLPIISMNELYNAMPFAVVCWGIAGGLFYSIGTLFLNLGDHYKYFHALWHTFVIAGSTSHYIAILLIAI